MTLPQTGFLFDASEDLRETLEALASEVTLDKGEVLFDHGDTGDALFAVISGRLEVSVMSEDGRRLVLDIMRPGALLGEIALFDPGERTATVAALEPAVLRRVKNADLSAAIQKRPELGIDLLRLAGQRMRWMSGQIGDQVFLPLPTRLARKVLYLTSGRTEDSDVLMISQAQLADFVGATREAVSKILAEWKRAGVVEPVRGGMAVKNRNALHNLAGQDML
jgi:CRP-like cAMP-binding protein